MQINEPDEQRIQRLQQYRICQERGHEAAYGLGSTQVCKRCKVHYWYVLQEDVTTLPTGVNRMIPGTNMSKWQERDIEVVYP